MKKTSTESVADLAPESVAPVKVDEVDYGNVDQFLLSQDFEAALGVQSELMAVSIRKPKKTEWFRAHPTFQRAVITYRPDDGELRGEHYVLTASVAKLIKENVGEARLVLCVSRAGVPFFWPVMTAGDRENTWRTSAERVLAKAREQWVRCVPVMQAGAYEAKTTTEPLPEPEFPDDPLKLLAMALEKRGISSADHPAVKSLLTGA